MNFNLRTSIWMGALAMIFLFASSSRVHAQCAACTPNTPCGTASCEVNVGGLIEEEPCTTCCVQRTTTTLFCTAQFLNPSNKCVQVEVDTVTSTCGTISTTNMVVNKQKAPGGTCTTCPTEYSAGCLDQINTTCPIPPNPTS